MIGRREALKKIECMVGEVHYDLVPRDPSGKISNLRDARAVLFERQIVYSRERPSLDGFCYAQTS